jgi:hypothetical protein
MTMLFECNDGAQKNHPNKQPARQLLGQSDPRIQCIAHEHIAEHQHHHDRKACRDQSVEDMAITIYEFFEHASTPVGNVCNVRTG